MGHDIATATAGFAESTRTAAHECGSRQYAECSARLQTCVAQLALDLLVSAPDITGFFKAFVKSLIEECDSVACGVWLLDEDHSRCDLWMAYMGDQYFTSASPEWASLALPREALGAHLVAHRPGWVCPLSYDGDDAQLPEPVRAFNEERDVHVLYAAPMVLSTRTLGWIVLAARPTSAEERNGQMMLVEAMALQATLALHQSRLAERTREEERRQAVLEERNRIARDIHDTLAQGFGAILMQLQSAQRAAGHSLPPDVARSIDTAIELARSHMIEARRSVGALRPPFGGVEDVASALQRIVALTQRTTEVPIALEIGPLPEFERGVEREIVGIAQEALTNAVRHARARRIVVQASAVRSAGFRLSVADDGRGIPREHCDAGFGMTSMQERAERIGASLTIVTAPRAGTEIVLAWTPRPFSVPTSNHVAG